MQFSKEMMKGAAEIIVLQTLKDIGEAYGYQLVRSIAEESQNLFQFQEGTLYPLLYRLEIKGYISSKKKIGSNGKERRYYSLTSKGGTLLKDRTTEYAAFLTGLKKILHFSV